jgi:hypothetical protein
MPELTIPRIRVNGEDVTKGLREISREDIAKAMPDVDLSKVDLSKVDLSKVEMPKFDLPKKIELPEIKLSSTEVELPRKIELPKLEIRARRSGPPAALVIMAVVCLSVAAWMVTMSPMAPRIRRSIDDLRLRVDRWRENEVPEGGVTDPTWTATDKARTTPSTTGTEPEGVV